MKKLTLSILVLGIMLMVAGSVSAARTVDGVTLNGGSSVTVAPGETITVAVTVTITDYPPWTWRSTNSLIEGMGAQCMIVPDPDITSDGTYTRSYTITAPLTPGTYDYTITAHGLDNTCPISQSSTPYVLTDAITVATCEITIDNPEDGLYYNDNIFLSWTANDYCYSSSYDVYYKEGNCDLLPALSWHSIVYNLNDGDYSWASGFTEGEYCIKVETSGNGGGYGVMEDTFYIDNIDPVADANGPYICNEGGITTFNAAGSYDPGTYYSGVANYEWFVDGVSVYDGTSDTYVYTCVDGDAVLDVELVVYDEAGNSGSHSSTLTVNNINPWDLNIVGPTDAPTGVPVEFSGSAEDVDADKPTLTYTWTIDGIVVGTGQSIPHNWTSASLHSVMLTVTDKDGGATSITHLIDVVEPTALPNQEVIAFHELDADFGAYAGITHSFMSGLIDLTSCTPIVSPIYLDIVENGNDCVVEWNSPRPTNDEQGVNPVIIRVQGTSGAYDYYSFDVTVYSWMIELSSGWNLISIPLAHSTGKMSDVIPEDVRSKIERIWSYDYNPITETSSWSCVKPTSATGSQCATGVNKITHIIPGKGYWVEVKSGEEAVLKGFGKKASGEPLMVPEVKVPYNDWTLIGRYGIVGMTAGEFGELHKSIALQSLSSVIGGRTIYEYDGSSISLTNGLNPQDGYWAFIQNAQLTDGTYTPINTQYNNN
ncbi:MAG: PKD domain-containing protein [archaeon]